MKLVHFIEFNNRGLISFVANKIVVFTENPNDEGKTSIFVQSGAAESEEWVVNENYPQVVSIMEKLDES